MLPPPLLARAVALYQQDVRGEIERDRHATRAVVGTRTRGGFFHLTARATRPAGTGGSLSILTVIPRIVYGGPAASFRQLAVELVAIEESP